MSMTEIAATFLTRIAEVGFLAFLAWLAWDSLRPREMPADVQRVRKLAEQFEAGFEAGCAWSGEDR